ncbi:MAG: STAS domain-containing protein [Erysipelotrichaceae bacterium]|nr:STAS domain-containing protein [Erysipelotrichaceae bacterium]
MIINKAVEGTTLFITLIGRLDANTSPELEEELYKSLDGMDSVIYDFKDLDYISSAGLRVLLISQKQMNRIGGTMIIKHVNDIVNDIFEVTGFTDILTIEE